MTGPVDTGKHPGSWETGRLTLDTQEGKRFIEDEVMNNNNNHFSNEGGSDIGANQGYLQWSGGTLDLWLTTCIICLCQCCWQV